MRHRSTAARRRPGPPWSDDAASRAPTPRPAPHPPPVVGGRFAPIMGLRRNAVEYAESMWRGTATSCTCVVGPPGLEPRRVVGAPPRRRRPGAVRQLVAGLRQAGPGARRDRPLARARACSPPRARTGPGRSASSSRCSPGGRRRLRRPDGRRDRAVVGEWDTEGSATRRPRPADAAAHPAGGRSRRCSATSADDVLPHVRHSFPAVSDTILRRGLGAVRLPAGIPTRARAPRPGGARRPVRGVRRHRRGAPGGAHHRRDRPAQPAARRARRRRAARRRGGAQPGARCSCWPGTRRRRSRSPSRCTCSAATRTCRTRVRAEVREVLGDGRPTAATVASAAADDGGAARRRCGSTPRRRSWAGWPCRTTS